MNRLVLAAILAAGAVASGCSYLPPTVADSRRVSPDYMASGSVTDARAYVYSGTTVLEFDSTPTMLLVRDPSGAAVDVERVGRFYRLPRALDRFTVWINGRAVTFSAVPITRVFSSGTAAAPAPARPVLLQPAQPVAGIGRPVSAPQTDADARALLDLSNRQLAEVRQLLKQADRNPRATGGELAAVSGRLDAIEAQMVAAAAVLVRVSFGTGSTRFEPDAATGALLVRSARRAETVNVRGYTDSRVAGSADARIALGRAMAARSYLLAEGIEPGKVRVFSEADGHFIAPNATPAGRTMNRRVEFEFVPPRSLQAGVSGKTAKL